MKDPSENCMEVKDPKQLKTVQLLLLTRQLRFGKDHTRACQIWCAL